MYLHFDFGNLCANFDCLLDPWLILINIKSKTNIDFGFLVMVNALNILQLHIRHE